MCSDDVPLSDMPMKLGFNNIGESASRIFGLQFSRVKDRKTNQVDQGLKRSSVL
jgi:hypothetical protein